VELHLGNNIRPIANLALPCSHLGKVVSRPILQSLWWFWETRVFSKFSFFDLAAILFWIQDLLLHNHSQGSSQMHAQTK
jgi:hypothetical protein